MRIKQEINRGELEKVVQEIEASNTFTNRSALFKAISETDWAKGHKKPLTSSVVMLRINEFNIPLKTPKGKKGAGLDGARRTGATRERKKANPTVIAELRRATPKSRHRLVDKIETGSIAAAVKLMCIQCSNYQNEEIKNCTVITCALHSIRPYQNR